jgi:tetratricopeptide (TPR) repeat protein
MDSAVCPVTIGRTTELARLREALTRAAQGESSFVLLTGDAGIGKTRLAGDAAALARELGMTVLWGSCAVADLSLPYLPYVEAIGNQLLAPGTAAIAARLGPGRRELAHLFPQLDLDAPPPDPSDTGQSRLRLYEAILQLLRELGAGRGLLLVIDDLQWADGATLEFLDYQLRRLQSMPVVVLATCRVEELSRQHPLARQIERWRRSPSTLALQIGGLDADEVASMLREILEVERVGPDVARLLYDRCGGNPYAIEETLKSSIDRGGRWEQRLPEHLKLPRTVRDTLLSRLQRLPEPAVDLLRAASVLRSPFDYPTLRSVAGADDVAVQGALRLVVEEQFLEEDPNSYEEYRFRHPLTREAVYEDMLAPQREVLHLRAAEALAGAASTPAVDLAHHMLAARRWEAAVPLALEAAEAANRAFAYSEAARLYERVLPLVLDPATAAGVRCELGAALLLAGDTAHALTHLQAGVGGLDDAGSPVAAAHHRLALGRCLWERGEIASARAAYEKVRDDLAAAGPSEDLALAYVRLAGLAIFGLDGPQTVRLAEQAESLAASAGADAPRIWAYNYHGLGLVQLGQVDEGLAWLDRSYREAHERGLNVIAANALYNSIVVLNQHFRPREALDRLDALHAIQAGSMASLQALRAESLIRLWGTGEPELARLALEAALAQARAGEATHFVTWIETQLAVAWLQLDDPRRAAELLPREGAQVEGQDRVVEAWARMRLDLLNGRAAEAARRARALVGHEDWPLRVRLFLSDLAVEALVAAGDVAHAQAAVEWCRAAGATEEHRYLVRMLGRIALASGDAVGAAELLRRAADMWGERSARSEEAWTRLALAQALTAAGDPDAAALELRAAAASARQRSARLEERVFTTLLEAERAPLPLELIQEALEDLGRPSSPAMERLRAAAGLDAGGPSVVARLTAAIERATQVADPRDAEAGRVLREYYVRRIGSHELVAERLHLSRTTFYRRLHRGWAMVAEDLSAGDQHGAHRL